MRYGDHFVNGDVKNSNKFENIGVYLMKDGKRRNVIMAASTIIAFAQRLGKHLKCNELKGVQTENQDYTIRIPMKNYRTTIKPFTF